MKKGSCAKLVTSFVSLLLIFSSLALNGLAKNRVVPENDAGLANWTVMYYLCCENHVSYEAAIYVENLTKIGSSSDFNLVVLKDGDQDGDSALYYIEKDHADNLNDFYDWPDELDMGNPNTLVNFINLVKSNYPAKHYALIILSDMGSGWQGICHDARNPNKGIPIMSMPFFANALKKLTNDGAKKIDVIGFMPCVTGMFEVAYELSPYVKYMVASEEHQLEELDKGPEHTWQYIPSTWNLKNNTDMTPEEFACSIVDYYNPCDFPMWAFYGYMIIKRKGQYSKFVESFSNFLTKKINKLPNPNLHFVTLRTTLSATNLSKINEVTRALDNLTSMLLLHEDNEYVKEAIKEARKKVREYGKFYVKNRATAIYYMNFPIEKLAFDSFIDLYHLVKLINESAENESIKEKCTEVMEKLNNIVIANNVMPDDESHGLSIYFPENKNLYNKYLWSKQKYSLYEDLRFSHDTNWDEFLKIYLNIL